MNKYKNVNIGIYLIYKKIIFIFKIHFKSAYFPFSILNKCLKTILYFSSGKIPI